MTRIKDQLAKVGMGTLVTGLKTAQSGLSKKQYKRLIATAVAQLLTMHPDFGPGQARRRARKVVGAKPSKKVLVKRGRAGLKEGLETAAVATAGGAALKVAGKLARRVSDKVKESVETQREDASAASTR
jgi:hypothetical protein